MVRTAPINNRHEFGNNYASGLDTTIAADVQGPVLLSLGEIEKLPWIGIGFPMGSVSIILLVGVAYGLFNIKILYIASIVLFEVGSAVCGAAPNMNAMICGRIIAGMGGAGIYLGYVCSEHSLGSTNRHQGTHLHFYFHKSQRTPSV
jgi:MFS family permease